MLYLRRGIVKAPPGNRALRSGTGWASTGIDPRKTPTRFISTGFNISRHGTSPRGRRRRGSFQKRNRFIWFGNLIKERVISFVKKLSVESGCCCCSWKRADTSWPSDWRSFCGRSVCGRWRFVVVSSSWGGFEGWNCHLTRKCRNMWENKCFCRKCVVMTLFASSIQSYPGQPSCFLLSCLLPK